VFELVYFARPNSTAFGPSVYRARTRLGEELARIDLERGITPDVVVPIPDSVVPAAIGYALFSPGGMPEAVAATDRPFWLTALALVGGLFLVTLALASCYRGRKPVPVGQRPSAPSADAS